MLAILDVDVELGKAPSQLDLAARSISGYARAARWLAPYIPLYLATESAASRGEQWDPDGSLAKEWKDQHEQGARDLSTLISDMKGFYVKVGQLIATRIDLFPKEYSDKLSHMVDSVNPLPFNVVRQVVEEELLGGYHLSEVFESFDKEPLGSASIAQVHKARLKGGQEVAVKVQRPNVEAQLLDDISVIKSVSKQLKSFFPVDYYQVFSELEDQLKEEFDFYREASSMQSIAAALRRGGREPPVLVPQSIPGLVSSRVMCMDFVPGVPLSQLGKEMEKRGIDPKADSRVVKALGRKLLQNLSDAFATMILEEGFFHADPHPGNVFVMPDGKVALIDFGQVKRIGYKFRRELAELIINITELEETDEELRRLSKLGDKMGLKFAEDAHEFCPAALGLYVLDWSREELPGGYSAYELSPRNVMGDVTYFPPEWVLTCRALQLLRGLAARLGIDWNLPEAWRESALRALGRDADKSHVAAVPKAKGLWPRVRGMFQKKRGAAVRSMRSGR